MTELLRALISALTRNDCDGIIYVARALVSDYAAVERLALWYEAGAAKYGEFNWTKFLPRWQIESSMVRHMVKLCFSLQDEDHTSAVLWNIAAWRYFSGRKDGWYDTEKVRAEERWGHGG